MPASGKGTFAEVARELNIPVIVMGDIVRRETLKRGFDLTPENIRRTAIELRKEHGEDVIARMVIEEIKRKYSNECIVLVDGSRTPKEIEVLKREFRVMIIGIEAPFEVRLKRLALRGREDDIGNVSEILRKREEMELKLGLGEVLRMADVTLVNDKDIESFKGKVRALLVELIKEFCGPTTFRS